MCVWYTCTAEQCRFYGGELSLIIVIGSLSSVLEVPVISS